MWNHRYGGGEYTSLCYMRIFKCAKGWCPPNTYTVQGSTSLLWLVHVSLNSIKWQDRFQAGEGKYKRALLFLGGGCGLHRTACRILVPDQGWNPHPATLHSVGAQSLTRWTPREAPAASKRDSEAWGADRSPRWQKQDRGQTEVRITVFPEALLPWREKGSPQRASPGEAGGRPEWTGTGDQQQQRSNSLGQVCAGDEEGRGEQRGQRQPLGICRLETGQRQLTRTRAQTGHGHDEVAEGRLSQWSSG